LPVFLTLFTRNAYVTNTTPGVKLLFLLVFSVFVSILKMSGKTSYSSIKTSVDDY